MDNVSKLSKSWIFMLMESILTLSPFRFRCDSASLPVVAARNPPRRIERSLLPVDRLRILEEIWGAGCVFPGGLGLASDLVKPLAVDSSMTLCDLTAGLGGPSRKIAKDGNLYITGLEQNAETAARGHSQSVAVKMGEKLPITAYVPACLKLKNSRFDGIFGYLPTWRVVDKTAFFGKIRLAMKSNGGFSFTDFVIDSDLRAHPNLFRLMKAEPRAASAWSLADMIAGLDSAGLFCRVADDISDQLISQVLSAWQQFMTEAELHGRPRKEIAVILAEAEIWLRRLSALESGALRYYRFFSTLPPIEKGGAT